MSAYEAEPTYQIGYSIPRAGNMRAIPDVSTRPIPRMASRSTIQASASGSKNWYVVGGTSAGAPQWAAIASLGTAAKRALSLTDLYIEKNGTKNSQFFRDIMSGTNGTCAYYCAARAHYDYVTGLGSPLTYKF